MRRVTSQDVIATWLVADTEGDASQFPQAGHNSSQKEFQNIYWRCVVCFHATALRQAPEAKRVLYTNVSILPTVDGVDVNGMLAKFGVEIRVLPIQHRLGRDKVSAWNNQFYILDIIKDLVLRDDYATVLVLDSDCVWVRPANSLLSDVDRRGALSLNIPYTEEFQNNGASRLDMQQAAAQLADVKLAFVPHYSGGEIFAATRSSVSEIWSLAEPMWGRLAEAEPGAIKVYEEGQFLSIIYEILSIPAGTADPHCRRMWTAIRLNNVSAEDIWSSRCIWHLPMEKKVGFPSLFEVACCPKSWLWTLPPSESFIQIAHSMGLPKRKLKHWSKHVVGRAYFHLEKLRIEMRWR